MTCQLTLHSNVFDHSPFGVSGDGEFPGRVAVCTAECKGEGGRRMLTRWGSILKVTHSEVTKGRRVVVNGIPSLSLCPEKGLDRPPCGF